MANVRNTYLSQYFCGSLKLRINEDQEGHEAQDVENLCRRRQDRDRYRGGRAERGADRLSAYPVSFPDDGITADIYSHISPGGVPQVVQPDRR